MIVNQIYNTLDHRLKSCQHFTQKYPVNIAKYLYLRRLTYSANNSIFVYITELIIGGSVLSRVDMNIEQALIENR
jgi:hypothetical protein